MTAISPRGAHLQSALAMNLLLLAEHEKVAPAEVDTIVAALIARVRSWRPLALLQGGAL